MAISSDTALIYTGDMRMTSRDAAIVRTVDEFGQLSSGHIWHIHFHNIASKNSMDRVLQRLVKTKILSRIERRLVGGTRGGSGQFVYQIGSLGHDFLGKRGVYAPPHRTVKQHMLEIADLYIRFLSEERAGKIRMVNYLTEPDTHAEIVGAKLRPDLFVEYERISKGEVQSLWLEVDRGFESLAVVAAMIGRYTHVMTHATAEDIETIPAVVFIVPDERRKRNIDGVLKREAAEYPGMFRVLLVDEPLPL